MARTLRQSWLDEMGRAERAEAQLQQAEEERNDWKAACARYRHVTEVQIGDIACRTTQRDEAIERARVAEVLLEAAWLQSGHPHFQTWYKSLTPAQRGEGDV